MGVKGAVFSSAGQTSTHYIPGAYSRIDFVKSASGLTSINNAVIMGKSQGGEPNTLLWFSSPSEAENTLRSGDLLSAIKMAFDPSDNYTPQQIAAWRVNPGTQSTYNMLSGTDTIITLTAWDYGTHTNQLKIKLEDGTTEGYLLTIQFQSEDEYEVDNIYHASFTIQYTGSETACTLTIDGTTLSTTTTGATDELSITLADYDSITALVDYINNQTNYTCTSESDTPDDDDPTELDWVTDTDILTAATTFYANVQAIIDACEDCGWIDSAEYVTNTSGRVVPDLIESYEYFSGAVDGDYTSTEWETSLEDLERQDVQLVGCSSTSASIHALIKTHVKKMNSVTGKNERQAILGGAADETVAEVIARAKSLNSDAVMLCYPDFQAYNEANTDIVWWGPMYYAAKMIGLATCLPLNEPLTNKTVSVLGLKSLTTTELNKLIKGGVCTAYQNFVGDYVNLRSINTYQGTELQKCEFSMMREAFYVMRDLRNTVETAFVGRAMTNTLMVDVDTTVTLKLKEYAAQGLFNGDPQYWGYTRSVNEDQIIIEFSCYLTPPTNFIFITSHMSVYASTT